MKLRTEGGHFWITFDNGYVLSCFNGYGSHTENWDKLKKWESIFMVDKPNPHENFWESELVEIAIHDKFHNFCTQRVLGCGYVVETINVSELGDVFNIVKNLP